MEKVTNVLNQLWDKLEEMYQETNKVNNNMLAMPYEFCLEYAEVKDLYWRLKVATDYKHMDIIENILNEVNEKGIIKQHELRYSVNQERDFGEFKNTLTEIIIHDVSIILISSIVEYLGVELCDNCVQVIFLKGKTLIRYNIFFDDVINSLNKFIKYVQGKDI